MQHFEPYGPLEQLDVNLWHRVGEWKNTPFKRRMTVVRLSNGHLFIHNPFALTEADYTDLEKLGEVQLIVAPNRFHCSEAVAFKRRFPNGKLLVSEGAFAKVSKDIIPDGILPHNWPDALEKEIECFEFDGTRWMYENVFFHIASKTLIVTDLCFNMQAEQVGITKKIFEFNAIYKQFGPSRLFKYVFVNNKKRAIRSFERILDWDFIRVIVNHGDVLEKNAKDAFLKKLHQLELV